MDAEMIVDCVLGHNIWRVQASQDQCPDWEIGFRP